MPQAAAVAVEQVLVIPTSDFQALGHFHGFSSNVSRYFPRLLESKGLCYRPRGAMEQDPSFKQLIPYVVFRFIDADGEAKVFCYQRGGGGGEARLHAKRSVGVGGHISTTDAEKHDANASVYREGLSRELAEEVVIGAPYDEKIVGLINDDETPVGQVHLGVVHLLDIERPQVEPNEDDLADAGFQPVSKILAELEGYESWSQIVMRALFG
ncbi:hypothetical protein Pla175_34940 [Pirellulimonas nuda]|uniref:Phosphoesterase n=1 Tax=Pirellulimonas nuda TaxID=2528009 RepID=A0A518DF30_9BACT|nr:phosphoesterase [Pirellulimonas nuda]QDU90094.1 hypothetical protein Pla175_34940 [Pirellulimonas nuda]